METQWIYNISMLLVFVGMYLWARRLQKQLDDIQEFIEEEFEVERE